MAHVGLCKGRHDMRKNNGEMLEDFVWDDWVREPFNFKRHDAKVRKWMRDNPQFLKSDEPFMLYVTGLTPILTSFLNVWIQEKGQSIPKDTVLLLMHHEREGDKYVPQIFDSPYCLW
jgi:hypothetical protein